MIEEYLELIIKELGPTGLLICGLYILLGKHLKNISHHLNVINHEIGEIKMILKETLSNRG